jgi:flagellar basal body-associated protein FliL
MKKPSTRTTIASAIIIAIVASAAMILWVLQGQTSPSSLAQSYGSNGTTTTTAANSIVSVNPIQSTNKESG